MEVIYTGLRQTPEQIVSAALQEDADVIGLSILSGAHMHICPRIVELLKQQGLDDVLVVVGGIIPDVDIPRLNALGIQGIFLPGYADVADYRLHSSTRTRTHASGGVMATRTLLVADDSETVHRIVEMACQGQDIDVAAVTNGDEAMAQIAERVPALVLVDIAMPSRNGYEVAAFVRSRADLAHIPIVLMAGMFEKPDDEKARALGCVEVLVKPLRPQQISARLREWLESVPALPVPAASAAPTATAASETEDYFSRLDAAFQSLGRRAVTSDVVPSTSSSHAETAASGNTPTLQELLSRLPEETRTRLTPPTPASAGPTQEDAILDAIASRVVDGLAKREDILEAIARRIAQKIGAPGGH